MSRASALDVQALRRHILATMGFGLWATRHSASHLEQWQCRLATQDGLPKQVATPSLPIAKPVEVHAPVHDNPLPKAPKKPTTPYAIDSSKLPPILRDIHITAESYHMQAFCFRHFLILADSSDSESWATYENSYHRLYSKLCELRQPITRQHTLHYSAQALVDEDRRQGALNNNPAPAILLAQLYKLSQEHTVPPKTWQIVSLTALPYIVFGELAQKRQLATPTLEIMHSQPKSKSHLLQILTKE